MKDLSVFSDSDLINLLSAGGEAELRKRGYEFGWHKKEEFVGAIYILINPAFPDLVKIGYADDVQKRLKTFNSNSGLPDPYHCYAVYKVRKRLNDLKLHSLIDTLDPSLRHSKNREFYEMDCKKAYDILSAIAQINGNEEQLVLNPFEDHFFNKAIEKSADSEKRATKPALKFSMLGIPVGSTLVFVKDNSITCTAIDDDNHVEYNGKSYSVSGLAKELLKRKSVNGYLHFMYNGEVLADMRERLGV